MSSQVEEVIRETEEALKSMLPKDQWDEIDLSYITQELIADDEQNSAEKSQDEVKKQLEGFPKKSAKSSMMAYCFFGNNLYKNGAWWYWRNGNPNNSCDSFRHTCLTSYRWKYKLTTVVRLNCDPTPNGFAGN